MEEGVSNDPLFSCFRVLVPKIWFTA